MRFAKSCVIFTSNHFTGKGYGASFDRRVMKIYLVTKDFHSKLVLGYPPAGAIFTMSFAIASTN